MAAVNHLILELIETGRTATVDEIATIVAHVSQAPFASYLANIPHRLRRQMAEQDIQLPEKLPSVEVHLLKRVYIEQQWPQGTTAERYVYDLHQVVSHPRVQIWSYRYFEQPFIGFFAPSHVADAPNSEAYIFVAYHSQFGTITTGYQASSTETVFTRGFTDLIRHR